MKKLTLIILILIFTSLTFGQSNLLMLMDDRLPDLTSVIMESSGDSVKGHWVFDIQYAMNNSVDSITQDLSSNANNLSSEFVYKSRMLGDSPVYQNGNTLTFDGGTKCLYVPAASAGDFEVYRDNFSIEAWVKTSSTDLQYIVSKHSATENYFLFVRGVYGTLSCKLASNEGIGHTEQIDSDYNISDGEWHYIVWVINFDNNTVQLYGDGQNQTLPAYDISDIDSIATPAEDFCIGGIETNTAAVFNGSIAEVRFSKRALTASEILTHYNTTLRLVAPVSYVPTNFEIALFNDSLSTPITYTQLQRLDNFATKMKDSLSVDSLSEVFDIFYLLANETSEAALQNVVKRTHDATVLGTPVYTVFEGYAGNSASDGLNTNYNPSTQGSSYTLNSASMGLYSRTNSTTTGYSMGAAIAATNLSLFRLKVTTSNEHRFGLNSVNAEVATYAGSTAGLFIATRNSASEILEYYNGTILDTANTVFESASVPNINMYLLCRNISDAVNTPDTRQIAIAFMGSKLTASEISKLNNCIEWYMDALGKGVIP